MGNIQTINAASSSTSSSETTSSSQPLWSYQVKPNSYANVAASSQAGHYSPVPSLLDAFNGLSQRQGALSSSPFLSILPIILIAAGGMLLLLPFLTMMIASPFSGGAGFGAYNNGPFGYPQVGALNKKRSLADSFGQRGLMDLIEHVTTSIEEMTKKYSTPTNSGQLNKRAKGMNLQQQQQLQQPNESTSSQTQSQPLQQQVNHRSSTSAQATSGTIISNSNEELSSNNNLSGSS